MLRNHSLLLISCAAVQASLTTPSAAEAIDPTDNNIPVVITPTRLRQSIADVPASVTVITDEMLRRFGITSVPDALRLVPGMAVIQTSGSDFSINYHGTKILVPRRMNVLIDGISAYRPALARVDWKELPVTIEDIERIEVTRGPNSASYGANSMLAIVNIITKRPKEAEGTTLAVTRGSNGVAEGTARYGGKFGESTTYRLTVNRQLDGGFDHVSPDGEGHDSTRFNRVNLRSVTDLKNQQTLELQATFVQGVKEIDRTDAFQATFPDMRPKDHALSAVWRRSFSASHEMQIQAYTTRHTVDQSWVTCVPTATLLPEMFALWRANPSYANTILAGRIPSGGSAQANALAANAIAAIQRLGADAMRPNCVQANQDYVERRHDVELQDTLVASDALRLVMGVGARQDLGESQTYLGGRVANNSLRGFLNVEYKPSSRLSVNMGGFLEKDRITGSAFSPRIAFNAHLNENHTVRFAVSKGNRMPDIQEQRANWTYRATNFSRPVNGVTEGLFYQSATALGNLTDERIVSREIGYVGNLPQYGLMIDAKVFDDRLSNLISEELQLARFAPTNRNSVRLQGAEIQMNYEPSNRWQFYLAYSLLRNREPSTPFEQTQYARNSGALGVAHTFADGWAASLAAYASSADGLGQAHYGRQDFTLSKTLGLGINSRFTTAATIRHLSNRSSQYSQGYGTTIEGRYDNAMQYLVTFRLAY
jgi:iron complex outermembrane receptor protein